MSVNVLFHKYKQQNVTSISNKTKHINFTSEIYEDKAEKYFFRILKLY